DLSRTPRRSRPCLALPLALTPQRDTGWIRRVIGRVAIASILGAAVGCRCEPSETRTNVSVRTAEGASSATRESAPSASATASAEQPLTLERLQGRWRVQTSSGDLERGYAFRPLVGEVVRIEGAKLVIDDHAYDAQGRPITIPITKLIRLLP